MKAVVIHAPKDLRLDDQPSREPGAGEIRIRLASGGICGSDLHYFNHGGFGPVRLKEPMVLGHEVSGFVDKLGPGVDGPAAGTLVSICPSRPCKTCSYCLKGLPNHCLNMRFYGSAMPFPHIQGAFQQELIVDATQCVPADGLTPGEAAMAEPLSVGLHATRRAGEMLGKRVLLTGCGPIGLLAAMAARRAGAEEIVATDLADNALETAKKIGVDKVINVATDADALEPYKKDKGYFDVHYECSGAPAALKMGIEVLAPRGVIMQLGLGGDMEVPMMALTAKELDLRGSFRFHEEFSTAVSLMRSKLIDVTPVISHTIPLAQVHDAFDIANDRSRALKTQIDFTAS